MSAPIHTDAVAIALILNRLVELDILLVGERGDAPRSSPLMQATKRLVKGLRRFVSETDSEFRFKYDLFVRLLDAIRSLILNEEGALDAFSSAHAAVMVDGMTDETIKDDPVGAADNHIRFAVATAHAVARMNDLLY